MEEATFEQSRLSDIRSLVRSNLPQSTLRAVEQHPRFTAILKRFGIDDAWRDELIELANDLTDVTGIHVRLDEEY